MKICLKPLNIIFCLCIYLLLLGNINIAHANTSAYRPAGWVETDINSYSIDGCQVSGDGKYCSHAPGGANGVIRFGSFGNLEDFGIPYKSTINKILIRVKGKSNDFQSIGYIHAYNNKYWKYSCLSTPGSWRFILGLIEATTVKEMSATGNECLSANNIDQEYITFSLGYSGFSPNTWFADIDNFEIAFDYTPPGISYVTPGAEDFAGTVWQWNSDSDNGAKVPGLSGVVAVASGFNHSLALKSDGTVWAWGSNSKGQLGDGTSGNSSANPIQVKGPSGGGVLSSVKAIAAGREYSLALKEDGTVWTWGDNFNKWRGTGLGTDNVPGILAYPTQVKGVNGNGYLADITAIAAGDRHSLVLKSDGTVYGWGDNGYGQIGFDCNYFVPTNCYRSLYPAKARDLNNVEAIAVGSLHSLALKKDGSVWGWGRASEYQLLQSGFVSGGNHLYPVQITELSNIAAISANGSHGLALDNNGQVFDWGGNLIQTMEKVGEIENSLKISSSGVSGLSLDKDGNVTRWWPTNLNAVKIKNLSQVSAISAGGSFNPSLAVLGQGSPPTPTPPAPFLDLPWNYDCQHGTDIQLNANCEAEKKKLDFNEAALSINSFFDHTYPLLSSGLFEPDSASSNITMFENKLTNKGYSSHDGYDYGTPAKVEFEDNVVAAGSGIATYVNTCGACGNAIYIDHENGFQTRYYHLDSKGLITNTPNNPVTASAGQVIGKVGFTGNVRPANEGGAHIHFMVIEDKNKDGNFDDNVPDGLVDPFGWQSKDPDPWEQYSFFYNSQQRTGNKSYYLWKKKLDGLDAALSANGGVFNAGKYQVEFPQGATDQNLSLEMNAAPGAKASGNLESIGSVMEVILKDPLGSFITILTKPMLVTIDFSQADISRFKVGTLSIYSSTDRENWVKEDSFVDYLNKKASTEVGHLTYFALMGERLDTTAPTTTPDLQGEKGQQNWFRSDVRAVFDAVDNEGGLGVKYTAYKLESGDWQKYTDPLIFTTEGHHKIEFYSEDNDGNIEDVKIIEFDIDKTLPSVTASVDRTPDTDGWYNHPFTVTFTGEDNESGIDTCTSPVVYATPDIINGVVQGNCTDKAGNIGTAVFEFKYDSQAPTLTATASSKGQPYISCSWTNSDVQISFNCTDDVSGVNIASDPVVVSNEGKDQSVKGSCIDNAGNKSEVSFNGINIDKTSPEASIGYDLSTFDSKVLGKDNLGSTTVKEDRTVALAPKYTISDQAGNMLLLNTGKIKLGKQVALSINSLQYNGNPLIIIDANVFFTLAITDKNNKVAQLDQYYSLKNDKKIFTSYTLSSNITKIYTKNPGSTTYTQENKPGIVLLQLFTQQGSLKYNY